MKTRDTTRCSHGPAPEVVRATTTAADGEVAVVALEWDPLDGVHAYAVVRTSPGRRPRRQNPRPIRRAKSAAAFLSLVPARSAAGRALSLAWRSDPEGPPVDLGAVWARGLTEAQEAALQGMAARDLSVRRALGLAWVDPSAPSGSAQTYRIIGVTPDLSARIVGTVQVVPGLRRKLGAPAGVSVQAKDSRVLVSWNRHPRAAAYVVERADGTSPIFRRVSPGAVAYDITEDIDGVAISGPARVGFMDEQSWDPTGAPIPRVVHGVTLDGPKNGQSYRYRVAAEDSLSQRGAWSDAVEATPVRTRGPQVPSDLRVQALADRLVLTWRTVTRDVAGHAMPDLSHTYLVYRADDRVALEQEATRGAHLRVTLAANPNDPTTPTVSFVDTDPALVPPFGVRDVHYRVVCVDGAGRSSAPSPIVREHVPDTRPPGPTTPAGARGEPDHIEVKWHPNPEPDLAGYLVYRGVCDGGALHHGKRERCDFVLVGQVTGAEAEGQLATSATVSFRDRTLPSESPLCYAYWVRAYDASQNLFGGSCPEHAWVVCQRMRERTPPPAPVITGLEARDRTVRITWMSPPVADLRAFHVYRSLDPKEEPQFLAAVLADGLGTVLGGRWAPIEPTCDEIPARLDPDLARGSYEDTTVPPRTPAWYRVSAVDWLGNESLADEVSLLPDRSTFTWDASVPPTPTLLEAAAVGAGRCGVAIRWAPVDAERVLGIVVFRASPGGAWRQVSPIVQEGDGYVDTTAAPGTAWRYRAQAIDARGLLSLPSAERPILP